MSACDDYLNQLEERLPIECTVNDLVNAKIFLSPQCEAHARKVGKTPGYFKIGHRIMYPRNSVIEWLKEQKHEAHHIVSKEKIKNSNFSSRMASCC